MKMQNLSSYASSCGSGLLRHGLDFSRAWWTMRMINGEKDWMRDVSMQKVVTLNSCCDVIFPNIQVITQHNRLFSGLPTFGGKQYTSDQMSEFCISPGSILVTFFGCGGQVNNRE